MSVTQPIADLLYRCPTDLNITATPLRRAVIIGQCLIAGWPSVLCSLAPGMQCDFLLFNNAQDIPPLPPAPVDEYNFQLIQIPLRTVIPDGAYFRLQYTDVAAYEALFEESCQRLQQFLHSAMRWNRECGLLSFVCNFMLPQQNPMGRLLPRYDLRNFVYFIERLNFTLAEMLSEYGNTYFFDYDAVISTFGKKYFQDDAVWQTNHNSALTDADFERDQDRLEGPTKASDLYPLKTYLYAQAGLTELLAMYRTVRQLDMVKLVVIDVDDTIWRGVAAERTEHTHEAIEGWPLGLAEALGFLKRRGLLLAVLSKNEESLLVPIWQRIFGNRLALEDFAIRKINWRPKAENFEEILQDANLLPRNVVYIDDNPVEREAIKTAFPDVRVFGPTPLVWRRILLWAPETQLATITKESATRTEMVQAQVERESQRKRLSRDEFLSSLNVDVTLTEISNCGDSGFNRALELINKSNQYNTTGRRWTWQECSAAFASGTRFFVFEVTDKFTAYGLVGVLVVHMSHIVQFVMSCRVVGLEVEIAAVATVLSLIAERSGDGEVTADLVETELNLLARDLWTRCGFEFGGDKQWKRSTATQQLNAPRHIEIKTQTSPPTEAVLFEPA